MPFEFEDLIDAVARRASARSQETWYSGQITAHNTDDGSYHVRVFELGIIYPRVFRRGPDSSRVAVGELVTLRARGPILEIVS